MQCAAKATERVHEAMTSIGSRQIWSHVAYKQHRDGRIFAELSREVKGRDPGAVFQVDVEMTLLKNRTQDRDVFDVRHDLRKFLELSTTEVLFLLALPHNKSFYHSTSHEKGKEVIYCCYITL